MLEEEGIRNHCMVAIPSGEPVLHLFSKTGLPPSFLAYGNLRLALDAPSRRYAARIQNRIYVFELSPRTNP